MREPTVRIVVADSAGSEKVADLANLLRSAKGVQISETESATVLDVIADNPDKLLTELEPLGFSTFRLASNLSAPVPAETVMGASIGNALVVSGVPVLNFETRGAAFAPFLLNPLLAALWFEPCGRAIAVHEGSTTYTESVRGKATSAEKRAALQKAYEHAFDEAAPYIPSDQLRCERGCVDQYKILLPEFEFSEAATLSGSLEWSGEGKGITGTLSADLGTLYSTIRVEIQWVVLGLCVRERTDEPPEPEPPPPGGGAATNTEDFGGGTNAEVSCGGGARSDGVETEREYVCRVRDGGERFRTELAAAKNRARVRAREMAVRRAKEYIASVPPCMYPCPKETVFMTIGPLEARARTIDVSKVPWSSRPAYAEEAREVWAEGRWFAARKCERSM